MMRDLPAHLTLAALMLACVAALGYYAHLQAQGQLQRCDAELRCTAEGGAPVWSEGACGCVWRGPGTKGKVR